VGLQENLIMTGQGFPPHYRLHVSREFDAVFKGNKYRVSGPQILVLGIDNHLGYSRLGMVVGKKSAAKSVQRSRIKRAIRESFRTLCNQNPDLDVNKDSVDIVIVTRSGVALLDNQRLAHILAKNWLSLFSKVSAR
jgi:ribonuclease P protein component